MGQKHPMVKLSYEQVEDVIEQEIARMMKRPIVAYLLRDRALEVDDLKNELRLAAFYALQRFQPQAVSEEEYRKRFRTFVRWKLKRQLIDLSGKTRIALPYCLDEPEQLKHEEVE